MEMARISAFVISRCANAYCGIKGTGSKFSQDRIGWVLTSKSMFTVKSAYEFRADCAEAIKLIHQDDHLGGSLIIVHHIQEFLKKNWCISYVCINRVKNRVADALATTISTSDFSLVEFDDPPNFVLHLLQEDMNSFSAPT
ncbi:hypothetical protein V6N13_079671 [Hibiscus sabdariffa]